MEEFIKALRVMSSNLSLLTTILLGSRAINLQKRIQKRVPFLD